MNQRPFPFAAARGDVIVRPVGAEDRDWMNGVLSEHWGSARVVSRGRLYDALASAGFVAWAGDERLGFTTYRFEDDECEILTLNSLRSGRGVGRSLTEAVAAVAENRRCRRIWLVTTNDNLHAQGFWKAMGFSLRCVHEGAMTSAREIKPEIPLRGEAGVPITDELEFERFPGKPQEEHEA